MLGDLSWTMVTGGAGFIGSHTVDALIESHHRVIVVDNFSTGSRQNLARWSGNRALRVIEADICDGLFSPVYQELGTKIQIRYIVHLAAQTSVVGSLSNPLHDIRNNYVGTAHVLDFARAHGVQKVVFASSSSVYADGNGKPVSEDAITCPASTYANNKLACEHLLGIYQLNYGVPGTVLRFFNVYGPRQLNSSPYSGVISLFCARALRGEPLVVHGDGTQTRDFVFITDVASAIRAALERTAANGAIINVGRGVATTIRDLAESVRKLVGSPSEIRFVDPRPGSIYRSCAMIERATSVLGFRPAVDLDEGLQATLAWNEIQQKAA